MDIEQKDFNSSFRHKAWICLVNPAQGALPDFVTAPVSADLYVSNWIHQLEHCRFVQLRLLALGIVAELYSVIAGCWSTLSATADP